VKILVTGGTGFAGRALCRRLVADGHSVTALHSRPGDADGALQRDGVTTVLGSVTDPAVVRREMAGCDRVYHLAAAFRRLSIGADAYHDVNVNGTRTVMQAALDLGVARVVHCSSCGVHGDVKHPPANEAAPIAPGDYYQRSKWSGELVVRELVDRGLWATIVRPTAIFGPGDRGRFLLLYQRVATGRFLFLGDGSAHYHPVFIDNLVDGFIRAAETDRARGERYLIGNDRSLPIRELVLAVARSIDVQVKMIHLPYGPANAAAAVIEALYKPFGAEPPIHRRRLHWFRQNRSFDIGKARRELGYEPRVDLDTGLRRTGEWYRQQQLI
jgi:nucleoside-diphosphate-sugar epimerase